MVLFMGCPKSRGVRVTVFLDSSFGVLGRAFSGG